MFITHMFLRVSAVERGLTAIPTMLLGCTHPSPGFEASFTFITGDLTIAATTQETVSLWYMSVRYNAKCVCDRER